MFSILVSSRRLYFYPRPPRGGRLHFIPLLLLLYLFLSTPSARRATYGMDGADRHRNISIHALREYVPGMVRDFYPRPPRGGRPASWTSARARYDFYPRPPRGGRPGQRPDTRSAQLFLSTPSARRATAKTETKSLFSNKLYNILHEFRRALIYNGSKNYPNHAKRLENPVRRCRKDAEDSPFAPGRKTQNNSRPSCSKGG